MTIKRVGKTIATGDSEWNKNPEAQTAMHTGFLAKFTQNEYLGRALQSTAEGTLAEANPHDSVWGIGLHHNDPRVAKKLTGKVKIVSFLNGYLIRRLRRAKDCLHRLAKQYSTAEA